MPLPFPFLLPGQGVGADGELREFTEHDSVYDAKETGPAYEVRDAYGKIKDDYVKPGSSDFKRCEDQVGKGKRVGTLPPMPFPPPSTDASAGSKRAAAGGEEGERGRAAKGART